jgi:hypothetical protein
MAYLPDIPGQKEIASFPWHAVKGDIIPSKTQPGDLVIPRQVMEQNPDIANLAKVAILQSGGLPSNYIAGDPNGMYNPYTGEQNFGFWSSLVRIAAPIVGFALGGPAGAAAASAAATKATGGSWEEAALSAGVSYIGASMSAPSGTSSAGAAAADTSTAAGALASSSASNAAATEATKTLAQQTVGEGLAGAAAKEGLTSTLAKGATNVINWLPDAAVKNVMATNIGQLGSVALNTQLAGGIAAYSGMLGAEDAAKQYEDAMKNQVTLPGSSTARQMPTATQMSFLPFSEAINSTSAGGVMGGAAPYASGASITGIPGVNMLNEIKNRDTGAISYNSAPYDSGSFSSSLSRGRRTGWGQNVVYA